MNIDEEKLATALADEWFKIVYEERMPPKELYEDELIDFHGMRVQSVVKDEYARLYFNKIEYYKQLFSLFEVD